MGLSHMDRKNPTSLISKSARQIFTPLAAPPPFPFLALSDLAATGTNSHRHSASRRMSSLAATAAAAVAAAVDIFSPDASEDYVAVEICRDGNPREDREDPFLAFVEHARSVMTPGEPDEAGRGGAEAAGPSWSWIVSRILRTCVAYSSGVTAAILLSDLSQVT